MLDPLDIQGGIQRSADACIRAAQREGKFDNLSGYGKRLPNLDRPFDQLTWATQWIEREDLNQPRLNKELRAAKHDKKRVE